MFDQTCNTVRVYVVLNCVNLMISALPVINNPFARLFLISIGLDSIGTLTHKLTMFPHYQMLLINAFIISDQQLNYRLRLETSEQTWDKLQLNQFNIDVQSIFKVTSTNYMYYFWVTIHVLRIFYYHEKPIILVHANKDFYTRPRVLPSILNDIV